MDVEKNKEKTMIDVCLSFDLYRDVNEDQYTAWAKKAIVPLLKSPGILEFRAHRNLMGSPLVRLSSTWKNLSDWANFAESDQWLKLMGELTEKFASNIEISIWGASPIAPGPLRPS